MSGLMINCLLDFCVAVIEIILFVFTKAGLCGCYSATAVGAVIARNVKTSSTGRFISDGKEIWICLSATFLKDVLIFIIFYLASFEDTALMLRFSKVFLVDIVLSSSIGAFYNIRRFNMNR